jgi:hypothetical protein
LLFVKPEEQQIRIMDVIMKIFGKISGLKINLQKSEMLITSSSREQVESLAGILQCKASAFPLRFLGLPLSDRPLSKQQYQDLIDSIQKSLPGWKAEKLSIAGRLVLLNSILTTKPLFFMSVFLLSKWLVKRIDAIRRRFLWHGHKENQREKTPCA